MAIGSPHDLVAKLEAERRGGGDTGVAGHEQVVFAFVRIGVAHQAPLGADRAKLRESPGNQLVWIDLMAGVPDEAVAGEVEGQVQGQAELDHAEVRGEVSRADAEDADEFVAHFLGELGEFRFGELVEILRALNGWQQFAHGASLLVALLPMLRTGAAPGLPAW